MENVKYDPLVVNIEHIEDRCYECEKSISKWAILIDYHIILYVYITQTVLMPSSCNLIHFSNANDM